MSDESIKTQLDAVLHFFKKLDIEMVDTLLDHDIEYADLKKTVFINKLGVAFDAFLEAGDDHLILYAGKCESDICDSCGCSGYTFTGNHSGKFMDLVIKEEKGRVLDIYDCSHFKSDCPNRSFDMCIKIDNIEFPFT